MMYDKLRADVWLRLSCYDYTIAICCPGNEAEKLQIRTKKGTIDNAVTDMTSICINVTTPGNK